MANNSFIVPTIGEIRRKAGDPTTAGVTVVEFSSENRLVSTLNGAFKVQPYVGIDNGDSQILFDNPVVDAAGNTILGYISTSTVTEITALWNA